MRNKQDVQILKVLLIEDNPADARLIQEFLSEAMGGRFELTSVDRLSDGIEQVSKERIDVILLDLGLPDSQGLDSLERMHEQASETPIIVLTGLIDEDLGIDAVRRAAQDYLVKGELTPALLSRTIRYTVERSRLLTQLEEAKERERREKEIRSFEQLSRSPDGSVTARTFGLVALSEGQPEAFNELVRQYGDLMDRALEQQAFKVDHKVSESLLSMAEDMGFLKAGPRDVVEVHSTAIKRKRKGALPKKAQAYIEEGRVMVLELMGYLTSYYLRRAK